MKILHDEGFSLLSLYIIIISHRHRAQHSTNPNGWRRLLRKIIECAMKFEWDALVCWRFFCDFFWCTEESTRVPRLSRWMELFWEKGSANTEKKYYRTCWLVVGWLCTSEKNQNKNTTATWVPFWKQGQMANWRTKKKWRRAREKKKRNFSISQ